jgi:hypothetical protein
MKTFVNLSSVLAGAATGLTMMSIVPSAIAQIASPSGVARHAFIAQSTEVRSSHTLTTPHWREATSSPPPAAWPYFTVGILGGVAAGAYRLSHGQRTHSEGMLSPTVAAEIVSVYAAGGALVGAIAYALRLSIWQREHKAVSTQN